MSNKSIEDEILGNLLTKGFGLKTREAKSDKLLRSERIFNLVPDLGRKQIYRFSLGKLVLIHSFTHHETEGVFQTLNQRFFSKVLFHKL
jgi:hypothetical protein